MEMALRTRGALIFATGVKKSSARRGRKVAEKAFLLGSEFGRGSGDLGPVSKVDESAERAPEELVEDKEAEDVRSCLRPEEEEKPSKGGVPGSDPGWSERNRGGEQAQGGQRVEAQIGHPLGFERIEGDREEQAARRRQKVDQAGSQDRLQ